MIVHIIRRVLGMIPTLIVVSMLIFLVIELPPGDFVSVLQAQLENEGTEVAQHRLDTLRKRYALDRPFFERYLIWAVNFLRGDMGESFLYQKPVAELVGERLLLTAAISLGTIVFTVLLAIPIGIYSATHQYRISDQVFTFLGFIGLATPNFLLALMFIMFSMHVFGMSPGGLFSPQFVDAPWSLAKLVDMLGHIWVPIVIVGTSGMAGMMRVMRGNVLDIIGSSHVNVARAKGLREKRVVRKYVVREALNPIITSLGMQLPAIIGGSTIVSIVLGLQTTGPLLLQALRQRDMFLAGSMLVVLSFMLLIGNLLADIVLAWTDPRIQLE